MNSDKLQRMKPSNEPAIQLAATLEARSLNRWAPVPKDPVDLEDIANLVADINRLHGARVNDPSTNVLIARLLLGKWNATRIFAHASQLVSSRHVREAVRYNGTAGLVDIQDVIEGREGWAPGAELQPKSPPIYAPPENFTTQTPGAARRAIQEHAPELDQG